MNEKKMNAVFERMSPTKEQREKMFDKINKENASGNKRRNINFKKVPAFIAAAAVIIMSTTTVYATNAFGIADFLGKVFKGGETLETSAYIPLTEKTSTNADVDMNVLGVIASESSVNVIVELTRNDGKDFPERFECIESGFHFNNAVFGYGSSRSHIITEGNKAIVLFNANVCGNTVDGEEVTIEMTDLCERDMETVFIEGEWSVTFDVEQTLEPLSIKEKTTDEGIVIKNAEITPLSISVTFENIPEKYYQNEDPSANGFLSSCDECIVVMKDGTKIAATGGAGAAYDIGEHRTESEFTFSTVIDMNEVDYILIKGEKLEIDK